MSYLFVADLHLEAERPEAAGRFVELLEQRGSELDALYILGDLFEFWIGDDFKQPGSDELAGVLRKHADSGLPIFFQHGNRDFLLGKDYAAQAGFALLDEEVVHEFFGEPTLLMHGDSLCIDDVAYQEFRAQVRDPEWQQHFLAASTDERLALARQARAGSQEHTRQTATEIMDVNAGAVENAMERHGVRTLIHGHTHRPAIHDLGDHRRRAVVGAWYGAHPSILIWDEQGLRLTEL